MRRSPLTYNNAIDHVTGPGSLDSLVSDPGVCNMQNDKPTYLAASKKQQHTRGQTPYTAAFTHKARGPLAQRPAFHETSPTPENAFLSAFGLAQDECI